MVEAWQRALVLAPHTDDGEFGCGGTMARLIESGVKVTYAAFSTAAKSVPEGFPKDVLKHEVRAATGVLGIASTIVFIQIARQLSARHMRATHAR